MGELIYSRVLDEQLMALREFCRINWGSEHPLIHNDRVFDWYYRKEEYINMVIAYTKEEDGIDIYGVCGFIPTSNSDTPDVFISYILSKKGAQFGIALRLIEYIKELTKAVTINCNNIRKKTRGIYEFLNYTVDDMNHWYRLNGDIKEFKLCRVNGDTRNPIGSREAETEIIDSCEALSEFPFDSFLTNRPYKDEEYVKRRYMEYPFFTYLLIKLKLGEKQAIIAIREIESSGSKMLRVEDFIGSRELIKDSGLALDRLLKEKKAEFIDWYSYGVKEHDMTEAGFSLLREGDCCIIPFYYAPLEMSNTDITIFTSEKEGFMMFRADGDQDRPNLG